MMNLCKNLDDPSNHASTSLLSCWFPLFQEGSSEAGTTKALLEQPGGTLILLELVGARGLSTRNRVTVDPYCVVKVGVDEYHRTDAIADDGDPIWTILTRSLCLVRLPDDDDDAARAKELLHDSNTSLTRRRDSTSSSSSSSSPGMSMLTIDICHHGRRLGQVRIDGATVRTGTGQRREYAIRPTAGSKIRNAVLAVRFRPASLHDVQFLWRRNYVGGDKVEGDNSLDHDYGETENEVASDLDFTTIHRKSWLQLQRRRRRDGTELYRVQPFADPSRVDETTWLSKQEVERETLQPSTSWVKTGYGRQGTIFVEILSAHDLPSMNMGYNNLSDPFVAIVFEDNMVRTDVLWDTLSPHWLPWTTRAFAFNIRHAASSILLGVFDYDDTQINYCDPIGRVVINTANLSAGTTYTLVYRLENDPRQRDIEQRGTLRVRLRIEWHDQHFATQNAFLPTPRFVINVHTDKSYRILRYLTRGALNRDHASLASTELCLKELLSYYDNICYTLDVLLELLLWRGRLTILGWSVWCPLHSLLLFGAVATSLERPALSVPLLLYGVAWIMLTLNYHASCHHNPWKRVKPSVETLSIAVFGCRLKWSSGRIKPLEGVDLGRRQDELDALKARRMAMLLQETISFMARVYGIYSKANSASLKMTSPDPKTWFNLIDLSGPLYYVHLVLQITCEQIRRFRNLIGWKGYFSNSLTIQCLFVATVWWILPVEWLVLWAARISVWMVLGPWVKLVDVFWASSWYMTTDELMDAIDQHMQEGTSDDLSLRNLPKPNVPDYGALLESDVFAKMGQTGRVVAENALKLKDMRTHLFGKYSEAVPHVDSSAACIPLSSSFAEPYKNRSNEMRPSYHVPGQRLEGNMVFHRASSTG